MKAAKLTACLSAIAICLAAAPLTAGAWSNLDLINSDRIYKGANGEAYSDSTGSMFLILTNGKWPLLHGSVDNTIAVNYEIPEEQLQEMRRVDPALDAFITTQDDTVRAFVMCVPKAYQFEETTMFRQLSIEHTGVIYAAKMPESSKSSLGWNGVVKLAATEAVREEIPEWETLDHYLDRVYPDIVGAGSAFQKGLETYSNWNNRVEAWLSTVDTTSMTAEELAADREKYGLETDYEVTSCILDLCNALMTEHSDVIEAAMPQLISRVAITADFSVISVWEHVGDLNEDGKVTAADASDLLIAAANNGAGTGSGLSAAMQQYADVNADGAFNAEDAALLLMYAAAQGSGGSMTLEEFVMNK